MNGYIKKFIVCFLLFILSIPISGFAEEFRSSLLNSLNASAPVSLGTPVTDIQILGNYVDIKEDGTTIFYGVTSGPPATLFVYNVDTGIVEDTKPLQVSENVDMAKVCYAIDMGADGILNIATQSNSLFFRYNPKTKELTCYGKVFNESAVMTSGYVDKSNNYYFGTYPNAKLIKYDKAADKLIDLGVMIESGDYIHSLSGYKNKIFMGGVGNPTTEFVKYDLTTGAKTVLQNPSLDGVFTSDDVGTYHASSVAGKYLFARCKINNLNKTYMCVFDMETEKWIDFIPGTLHLHATGYENGLIYYHNSTGSNKAGLFSYDPETKVSNQINGVEMTSSAYLVSPKFSTLKNQNTYPGRTLIAGSSTSGIVLINMETKAVKYIKDTLPAQATNIRTIKGGYNGDIIVSAYMGSKVVIYDSNLEKIRMEAPSVQIEGINVFDQKYYFGLYGKGRLTEFNPTLEGSSSNPKQIAHMDGFEQDRAFNVANGGNHIIWGSYPDYGRLGGAVGVYNKSTKRYTIYNKPVANQAIAGLAYQNNMIYGSTSVYGGLGIDPIEDYAKLFRMDLATGTVEKVVNVKLTTDTKKQYFVGDMIFDKDGNLWVACVKTLLKVNPDTLEIIKEIPIGSGSHSLSVTRALPYDLELWEDGLLYTNIGNRISAVDLSTYETKTIYGSGTIGIALSTNGYLYFIDSNVNYLSKIQLNRGTEEALPPPVSHQNIFQSNQDVTVNQRIISGPKGITFATVKETTNHTLSEYGMVFSTVEALPEIGKENCIKIQATVSKNSLGQYGILFNNVKYKTTYYTRPYSIYIRGGVKTVLYGEVKSFTPSAD